MRIALVVLVVAAIGGAGYVVYGLEGARSTENLAARGFDQAIHRLALAIRDLQAAGQASVAQGQEGRFWLDRAATLAGDVETSLAAAAREATDRGAGDTLAEAAAILENFRRVDARARLFVENGQHLLASDLIFADALEMTQEIGRHVEEAGTAERLARDAREADSRRLQVFVLAGTAAFTLLALLLLLPAGSRGAPAGADESLAAAGTVETDTTPGRRLGLRDLQALERIISQPEPGAAKPAVARTTACGSAAAASPVRPAGRPGPRDPDEATVDAREDLAGRVPPAGVEAPDTRDGSQLDLPAAEAVAPAQPLLAVPDLQDTARLCVDFARVAEAQELPGLLQRAASLLGASGIIVWVQNQAATELVPAVSHGYPPHAMSRMGTIARDADNAAAEAFRAGELRVVPGSSSGKGALVTPLITPTGPVGVMAAEVADGRESSPAVQATATIVAAQLATLIPAASA